ncbi:MAG: endo alpha-1,4 polygalactosaminidase [Anaerolineaceae bacterium]|nr:endo alpha-1,4 polygalactosaminidase [Anaerolineaceae bacterium]
MLMTACTSRNEAEIQELVPPTNVIPSAMPQTDWWKPQAGLTWQIQFTGKLDLDLETDMIDLDMEVDHSTVNYYHARGTRVVCYISAGSYEDWRADADQFPEEVLGLDYEGWAGEKWLDIRRIDLLAPIMQNRMDECVAKDFDGVEFDNLEVYTNNTGFPLTYKDQLTYAQWLADQAHMRGLAIGQKNASDMVNDLVDLFDFAIVEDAFYYEWTTDLLPYIQADKPVFAVEYTDLAGDLGAYCEESKVLGFSTILKHRNLDRWLEICE